MQLAELKQECLARGLEAKGNKQDLINRLQAYLEEHGTHAAPPSPPNGHGGSFAESPRAVAAARGWHW